CSIRRYVAKIRRNGEMTGGRHRFRHPELPCDRSAPGSAIRPRTLDKPTIDKFPESDASEGRRRDQITCQPERRIIGHEYVGVRGSHVVMRVIEVTTVHSPPLADVEMHACHLVRKHAPDGRNSGRVGPRPGVRSETVGLGLGGPRLAYPIVDSLLRARPPIAALV